MSLKHETIDRLRNDLMLEPQFQYAALASIVRDMSNTDQTSSYHREGDVLTHTYMVVQALDKVLEEKEGGADYKHNDAHKALLFAAWLHDIGKVSTAEWSEKKQRNTFNGHEEASAGKWRELYLHFEIDPLFGERVYELIKNHAAPTNYIKTRALDRTYVRLAERVCPYHLYLLELADMHGRICDDQETILDLVEKFYTKCETLGVANDDRFKSYRFHTLSEFGYVIKNKHCVLIPVATPGCGKSHLLKQLQEFHDMAVICPDDIRTELYGPDWSKNYKDVDNNKIFGIVHGRLKKAMQQQDSLIYFDAQNRSIKDRKSIIEMAVRYNYAVVCFWFRTKLETILLQNSDRERNVPEDYIKRALGFMQLPTLKEADYVVALPPR